MNKYLLEARKIHKKAIEEFEHGKLLQISNYVN